MSKSVERDTRNLGRLVPTEGRTGRNKGKRRTPAELFIEGRKAGVAFANRTLHGNLAEDIQCPEPAEHLRHWLRGFAAGISSVANDPPPT